MCVSVWVTCVCGCVSERVSECVVCHAVVYVKLR